MKTIIAPTDFSAASSNSVNYAADFAASLNANLVLLNVVEVPMAASEIPVPEIVFEDMVNMASQDLDSLVTKLIIRTNGKIDISKRVILGTVAAQIREVADEFHPFAIVMSIKPGNTLERFFIGSSTLSSVKSNPYPILIVPEHVRFTGIHKIGLACDLQNVIETIPFNTLNEWMSVFKPTLDIIHISKTDQDMKSGYVAESVSLENHLNKYKPGFHFLVGENLTEKLNEFEQEQNLDLLVIVPKKHGFLGIFDKKYSQGIISKNKTAILAIHI